MNPSSRPDNDDFFSSLLAREDEASLRLHVYVLSVTPPGKIGDESLTREEWEEQGVYFLNDSGWPQRVIGHVFGSAP